MYIFLHKTFATPKNPFRFVCSAAFCFLRRRRGSAIASDQTRCLLMQPSATSTAIYHRCFTFKQHRRVCTLHKYLSLEISSDGKHAGPRSAPNRNWRFSGGKLKNQSQGKCAWKRRPAVSIGINFIHNCLHKSTSD